MKYLTSYIAAVLALTLSACDSVAQNSISPNSGMPDEFQSVTAINGGRKAPVTFWLGRLNGTPPVEVAESKRDELCKEVAGNCSVLLFKQNSNIDLSEASQVLASGDRNSILSVMQPQQLAGSFTSFSSGDRVIDIARLDCTKFLGAIDRPTIICDTQMGKLEGLEIPESFEGIVRWDFIQEDAANIEGKQPILLAELAPESDIEVAVGEGVGLCRRLSARSCVVYFSSSEKSFPIEQMKRAVKTESFYDLRRQYRQSQTLLGQIKYARTREKTEKIEMTFLCSIPVSVNFDVGPCIET
ncbi:hypothetical protein [Erythrobacter sp. F6033]|uniref:hypothetical protein n=1 Tax=Erythrobacter sp. F6033 TaxID=2926401 RepID=UPI001FF3DF22|nr:hypothetical protein [Erythrobacter sp. F6033]MCK0129319.1 hypothetical protein [Erythrobacter sp. F6033]